MSDYPHKLPEAIANRLESFRRKLWWIKAAEAILAGIFGLLAGFLVIFGLERFMETPVWARLVLLGAATSLLAIFAPAWIHRWLWKHRRADQLARLVRRAHPRFGDRLLGAVELASQDESQTALSPVLRAAALRQIAAEAERRGNLEDALPRSTHRHWAMVVAALAILVAAGFIYSPQAGWNTLQRWLHPMGDTPRYTFTQLHPLPARIVVAQGEPFSLELRLLEDSKKMPDEASVKVGGDMPFTTKLDGRHYHFKFNGLLSEQPMQFHAGDAAPSTRVVPLGRPEVTKISGQMIYPDYLGLQVESLSLEDGALTIVEGGKLALLGELSRTISKGSMTPIEGPDSLPNLKLTGAGFTSEAPIEAAPLVPVPQGAPADAAPEGSRRIAFNFTDSEGLEMKKPFVLTLRTVPDAPSNVYLEGADREAAILDDEVVEFRVIGGDDFGVKRIGFDWTTIPEGGQLAPDAAPTGETTLGEGAAIARRLESPAVFSPALLKLGPQALRVRAWAEDFKPGRPRSYSEPLFVIILDRSQHAEMLRRRFGQLMDGLEELSRREETDHVENKRIEDLDGNEMRDEKNRERLEEQSTAEQKNREGMEKLNEAAKELFRDALRNKNLDADTMKGWSEMLKDFNELSAEDMPKVEELLQKAGDANNQSAEQQDKKMSEAVEAQKEVLEKMREAMRKANKVEQNMEAGTFVNRLRSAARTTKGIAGTLRESVLRGVTQGGPTRTAGLSPEALDKEDFVDLQESAKKQDHTRMELTDLQEDFGHFFRRTGKPVYDEIRREMDDARTNDNFDRMAQQIRKNWSGKTTPELLAWSDRLNEWANKLDPKKDSQGGGGGGGGGGSEASDVELMLRLLRFVQQTQDIQGQTKRVERGKIEINPPAAPQAPAPAPIPSPGPAANGVPGDSH